MRVSIQTFTKIGRNWFSSNEKSKIKSQSGGEKTEILPLGKYLAAWRGNFKFSYRYTDKRTINWIVKLIAQSKKSWNWKGAYTLEEIHIKKSTCLNFANSSNYDENFFVRENLLFKQSQRDGSVFLDYQTVQQSSIHTPSIKKSQL